MDASSTRVSALVIGKQAVELVMLAEAASRESDRHLVDYRKQAVLKQIGTLRRELTELECAVKGEPVPVPTPPMLTVVGS